MDAANRQPDEQGQYLASVPHACMAGYGIHNYTGDRL